MSTIRKARAEPDSTSTRKASTLAHLGGDLLLVGGAPVLGLGATGRHRDAPGAVATLARVRREAAEVIHHRALDPARREVLELVAVHVGGRARSGLEQTDPADVDELAGIDRGREAADELHRDASDQRLIPRAVEGELAGRGRGSRQTRLGRRHGRSLLASSRSRP
jgi:hypothetical protein